MPAKLGIGRRYALALLAWALSCVFALALGGCPSSKVPARDQTRGAVLVVAKGVALADDACARWGMGEVTSGDPVRLLHARNVLAKCSREAHAAATWLTFAEASLDTWDASTLGNVGCLISAARPNILSLFDVLASIGVPITPALSDTTSAALSLISFAAPSCAVTLPAPSPSSTSSVDAGTDTMAADAAADGG